MKNIVNNKNLWQQVREAEKRTMGGWIDGNEFDRWVRALNRAFVWAEGHQMSPLLVEGSLQGWRVSNCCTHIVYREGAAEVFRSSAKHGLVHDYVRIPVPQDHPVRKDDPVRKFWVGPGTGLTVGAPFAYFFKGAGEDQKQESLSGILSRK